VKGVPFTVYTPSGKRAYIYIDDVIEALKIVEKHDELDVINICSKDVLTSDQLAKMIAEFMQTWYGINPQITYKNSPYPEIAKQSLNCNKLKSLGWEQKYGIKEGLEITVKELFKYFYSL